MKSLVVLIVGVMVMLLSAGSASGRPQSVVERDVVYCSCHGIPLTMDLHFPVTRDKLLPVVLYIHGGGWYSGDKTDSTGLNDISDLVSRGYLVAAVNYRLAPRYQFPAQIEDVECAVRFLRAHADVYGLNPGSIGVIGASAGGHLAALLGLTDESCGFDNLCCWPDWSTRVQAVVDLFGPSDLTMTFQVDKSLLIEHVFNTSDPESDIIKKASPVTYITGNAPPFLIIHGDMDNVVLMEQSEVLFNGLVAAGIPATLIKVKNSGHCFVPVGGSLTPSPAELTRTIGEFFDRYLK